MMSEPVLKWVPNLEIVVFQWRRNYGDCYDCGLPAAYATERLRLCCVCAAQAAAGGEKITRLDEKVPS
jgi:hypothetical protein